VGKLMFSKFGSDFKSFLWSILNLLESQSVKQTIL
jgi:hypothetical protein